MSAKPTVFKALTFKHTCVPHFTEHHLSSSIGKTSLIVKVHAAALNPIDIKISKLPLMGLIPTEKGIGKDFSGEVVEVGENLQTQWKPEDRVCGTISRAVGLGSIASYLVVDVNHDAVMKIPKEFSYEKATAFPLCFGTAFQALTAVDSKLLKQEDSTVLILGGATAVGMFAIQLAKKYFGASNVIATCSEASGPLVRGLGADIIVDYRNSKDLAQDIIDVITSERNGKRCAIVVDCVGGHEVVSRFPDILLPSSEGSAFVSMVGDIPSSGHYTLTGQFSQFYRIPFLATRLAFGRFYGIRYSLGLLSTTGEWVSKANEVFENYDIRVLIDSVYDWNDWEKGWKKLDEKKCHGKVVYKVSD